ncbi:solute carrier family 23 member 3 isoform X2 [Petromyzon marinus]|uniref:solute carrier family 23 member 3 isoform X2 n=1 Tax=Petromyzon marinus TaxID=7757 RepID=UPI003F72369C
MSPWCHKGTALCVGGTGDTRDRGSASVAKGWPQGTGEPAWMVAILYAVQHVLLLAATLQASYLLLLLSPAAGVGGGGPGSRRSPLHADGPWPSPQLLATGFFCSGLSTLVQLTLGSRLPVLQGASTGASAPLLLLLLGRYSSCPSDAACSAQATGTNNSNSSINATANYEWPERTGELGGALLLSGLVQVLLGAVGAPARLAVLCGPMVLAPVLCLLGLAGYQHTGELGGSHWGLTAGGTLLLVLLSQHMERHRPAQGKAGPRRLLWAVPAACRKLSVLLTVALSWALCSALPSLSLPPGRSQDDGAAAVAWLSLPYPGRMGWPVLSADATLAGLVLAAASTAETLGCYVLATRLLRSPAPGASAASRGLAAQGLGCAVSGLLGSPAAAAVSLPNACALGLTAEGSRRSVLLAAVLCLLLGLSPRFSALLASLPLPVLGTVLGVTHGVAVGAGISYFQYLDMDSGRCIFIVGFSLFMALLLPRWMQDHAQSIASGRAWYSPLQSLLRTPVLLGGAMSLLLDSTVSGTPEERGLFAMRLAQDLQGGPGRPATRSTARSRWAALRRSPLCAFVTSRAASGAARANGHRPARGDAAPVHEMLPLARGASSNC